MLVATDPFPPAAVSGLLDCPAGRGSERVSWPASSASDLLRFR